LTRVTDHMKNEPSSYIIINFIDAAMLCLT